MRIKAIEKRGRGCGVKVQDREVLCVLGTEMVSRLAAVEGEVSSPAGKGQSLHLLCPLQLGNYW